MSILLQTMYEFTPVIAVNSGGPKETVVHGRTGLLCHQTAQSFSNAMLALMLPVYIPPLALKKTNKKRSSDPTQPQSQQSCKVQSPVATAASSSCPSSSFSQSQQKFAGSGTDEVIAHCSSTTLATVVTTSTESIDRARSLSSDASGDQQASLSSVPIASLSLAHSTATSHSKREKLYRGSIIPLSHLLGSLGRKHVLVN
jgi:hypothetical protein